jgi:hypothetical protein
VPAKDVPYPKDADDVIAFVEVFSQIDFSVNDASKYPGTETKNEEDHHNSNLPLALDLFPLFARTK